MTRIKSGTAATATITALVIAGLLVGVTASASAGGPGAPTAAAAKKKCGKKKGKSAATAKKKGCKKKPAAPVLPPAAPPAAFSISPASFTFPATQHHTGSCPACPTQAFTVTNTGGSTSGTPSASITEVTQPVIGAHDPGYFIDASTCTAALAPGGTCTVTVRFIPPSNAGDGQYTSTLNVTASPGSAAQASMSGHSN